MVEFSFFARAAALSVAEIVALTGAEPCEGAAWHALGTAGDESVDRLARKALVFL